MPYNTPRALKLIFGSIFIRNSSNRLATEKGGLLISDKVPLNSIAKTAILIQARLDIALLLCFYCTFEMDSYSWKHA